MKLDTAERRHYAGRGGIRCEQQQVVIRAIRDLVKEAVSRVWDWRPEANDALNARVAALAESRRRMPHHR